MDSEAEQPGICGPSSVLGAGGAGSGLAGHVLPMTGENVFVLWALFQFLRQLQPKLNT